MRHARRRGHVCQRPLAAARSACRAHRAKSSNKADAAHTPAHPNGAVRFFVRTDLPALKYTNPNVRVAVTREPERSALTVTLGTRAESISMPPSASCPPPRAPAARQSGILITGRTIGRGRFGHAHGGTADGQSKEYDTKNKSTEQIVALLKEAHGTR